jgi:hypothetical protein
VDLDLEFGLRRRIMVELAGHIAESGGTVTRFWTRRIS